MKQGRPIFSRVRQNMVEILHSIGKGYGYEIYKIYLEHYPKITLRLIYYHLKKGLMTGEFVVDSTEKSKGEYSWGALAEKTYYKLGPNAKPLGDSRLRSSP
jgi:hypothetical protein